jgi:hypothetical protein
MGSEPKMTRSAKTRSSLVTLGISHAGSRSAYARRTVQLAALLGLATAAVCLAGFIFRMTGESPIFHFNLLFAYFVACAAVAGIGLFYVYRLLPRRGPKSLFSRADALEFPAPTEVLPAETQSAPAPARSVSRYGAREAPGALGVVTMIGISLVLGGRVRGGWEFLSFALPAGCLIALILYTRQDRRISRYKVPASGGIIGLLAMIGLVVVMSRFGFLRYFLGLAFCAGVAIALILRRMHSRSSLFLPRINADISR